jgi:Predicted sugar kinase
LVCDGILFSTPIGSTAYIYQQEDQLFH